MRTATCTATERTQLGTLTETQVVQLRQEHPELYARLLQALAAQLAQDNRAVRELLDADMRTS